MRKKNAPDGISAEKKLQKNTGKVRKPLDENKKSNYDNICVLCVKVKGGRWMYMVDYEGTMPIFAYAYLTHDRRWTGPRAYRITIYQDDTLMFRTFNEREEVLDTDFFYLACTGNGGKADRAD